MTFKFPWRDHHVEALKRLHADGHSASQIAEELGGGVTRNAVIGKIHRLGLTGRGRQAPRAPRKSRVSKILARVRVRISTKKDFDAEFQPSPPIDLTEPTGPRVSITQLNANTCRWPYGDPASEEFAYCGAQPVGSGLPYCPYHTQLAYTPPSDRLSNRRKRSATYIPRGVRL